MNPHFLVTAGTTREPIDSVRVWSNIFTGQTGLDIALALLDLGPVTLLTSNLQHAKAYDGYSGKAGMLGIELFNSHADLKQLLAERITLPTAAVFMTAAISDYTPAGVYRIINRNAGVSPAVGNAGILPAVASQETWTVESVQEPKIKSSHGQIAIVGRTTEKLIELFRSPWNYTGLLIKFKLQSGISEPELIQIATASRLASQADYIVANTTEMLSAPTPSAYLIGESLCERLPRTQLPARLKQLTQETL